MASQIFTASIEFNSGTGAHDEQLDLYYKQQKLDCFREAMTPASEWGIVISGLRRDAASESGYTVDVEFIDCESEAEARARFDGWREAAEPARNWGLVFWNLVPAAAPDVERVVAPAP